MSLVDALLRVGVGILVLVFLVAMVWLSPRHAAGCTNHNCRGCSGGPR